MEIECQSDAFLILRISLIFLEEEGADEEGDEAGDINDNSNKNDGRKLG
ncbi:hypothetical protein [Rossellomorea marisflavi]|nr:hypothetical protein [Rossellomorea marisflavi]